jgi:hypothetical protein
MEITLGHIITVGLFVAGLGITYFAITIRNDQKILHLEDKLKVCEADCKTLTALIEHHKSNAEIHFSLAVSNQVQKRTDEKFAEFEKQLTKMESNIGDKFKEFKEIIKQISEKK